MTTLNENNLKTALHLYAQEMANSSPTDDELSHIDFSTEFERKMKQIIKLRKNPLLRTINTTAKKVACIVLIFIISFSVTFSVNAIREPFIKMIKTIFSNHIEIEFEGDTKDCITEIYTLKYIPDGFNLTNELINEVMVAREYTDKNGILLNYTQAATAHHSGISVDNENSVYHTVIVDGKEVYIFVWEKQNLISAFWVENGYSFSINYYFQISDDEIISMIKSNTITRYVEQS